ncbi:MAG TPA: hypothetical protein VFS56_11625 [Gemmatimonadaceae bacterium]|nr:hypothetical protein [Gemmatimonadaceae bacterium]
MNDRTSTAPATADSRQLADFFVILIGMSLLGLALYGGPLVATGETEEIRYGQVVWLVLFITGSVALIATGMAQWERWQTIARIVLAVDGLILLAGLLAFNNFGVRALLSVALPGVAFIVLSRFLGPIPRPATARSEVR